MAAAASLPYQLRPNKAADRELFLCFLSRLAAPLNIEKYEYIGLGGPFLEDFRLIHGRLGLTKLSCVESSRAVHERQLFNRPVASMDCFHSTLEEYIESLDFDAPVIIWFDYTDPRKITDQIEMFAKTIAEVPSNSVLRITLNANPESLGRPDESEVSVNLGSDFKNNSNKPTLQEWRLARFQERMGNFYPEGLTSQQMTRKQFGNCVLKALSLAVERQALSLIGQKVIWALSTHYSDGQPMVTATVVVCEKNNTEFEGVISGWEYSCTPDCPHVLDMPTLSALERLLMEASENARDAVDFELPSSQMGGDPFDAFMKFRRIYPHFSRVEL